jgi:hypothetical protein
MLLDVSHLVQDQHAHTSFLSHELYKLLLGPICKGANLSLVVVWSIVHDEDHFGGRVDSLEAGN